jgi:hypothetical protein
MTLVNVNQRNNLSKMDFTKEIQPIYGNICELTVGRRII